MEDQENCKQNNSSSFVDLQPSLYEEFSIGPGQYLLKSSIPSGPYYSFGRASRFTHKESYLNGETPVKEYDYSKGPISKRANSANSLQKLLDSPGPGTYDFSSTLFDKNVSLKGKYQDLPQFNTPGPGSYQVSLPTNTKFPQFKDGKLKDPKSVTSNVPFLYSQFKSSSPSYSIGRRHRTNSPPDSPGPGSYEASSTLISANFTLMPKREPVQGLNTPGPGSYSLDDFKVLKGFTIGLPATETDKNNYPGPGEYNIKIKNNGPKYSMTGRALHKENTDNREYGEIASSFTGRAALLVGKPKEIRASNVPGPGNYSPSYPKDSQGFAAVLSSRDIKEKETPGPGQYSQDLRPAGPFYSIGKKHPDLKPEEGPGPGQYESLQNIKNAPLLRGKPADLPVSQVPGPGQYDPSRSCPSLSFSQPRANRFEDIKDSPGPGDYYPAFPLQRPGCYFGTSKREIKYCSQSPGPGSYSPALSDSRIHVSLRGKPNEFPASQVPGPGCYNTLVKSSSPGFSQSKSARSDFTRPFKMNPGPGSYENLPQKPAGFSFTKDKRELSSPETSPGPGSYNWKFLDKQIGPTIRGKQADFQESKTPGPGHYNTDLKENSQSFQFGLKIEKSCDNKVPGPGTYDVSQRTDSPSWTIAKRNHIKNTEENPGPGTYDPLPTDSAKSFTIGLKREENIEQTPGPGDYENPLSKSNGFSFGKKFDQKFSEHPGPGEYDPKLKKTNPAWTISQRRGMKQIEESPGPGHYDLSSSTGNTGVVFSKLERKFTPSKNPGPGQYNTSSSTFKDSKISFGKCLRTDFTKLRTETPGPGNYYNQQGIRAVSGKFSKAKREFKFLSDTKAPFVKVELKPDGPFYSIGAKRDGEKRENTPGPGAYASDLDYKSGTPAFTMGFRRSLFKKMTDFRNYTPVRSRK